MNLEPPLQFFATTLRDRYQPQQSLSFVFLPARSLKNNKVPAWNQISNLLEPFFLPPKEVSAAQLPLALASLLPTTGPLPPFAWLDLPSGVPITIDPNQLGFAEYVAFAEVVPFEESPLKGKSPLAIAALAGAQIGLLAGGPTPLLFITVPSGILLCTAAVVIGPHIGEWVNRLLGV
jgi:hypothetical protein